MNDGTLGNRLLVVDDELSLCRVIQRTAEQLGFEVIVTDDPKVFSNTARLWQPTVIIMDLKMPSVDGIQLLRALAVDKCRAHIIISSGSDTRVLEAAVRLGNERGLSMSGMLQKPVRLEKLREMLGSYRQIGKDALTADLAAAIEADQLFLEYQPKFDCGRGKFTGVEALARWRHPTHGAIPPDQFIILAEDTGLIQGLTDRIMAVAAKQTAAWHTEKMMLDVAVNISARDVEDLDLPERLYEHCQNAGIEAESIVLELTETGATRQAVQMMDVLTRLRLKGFRLSIDDFGTGYSSLVQLQRMPFSEIKIDQSFVTHMQENAGCRTIAEIVITLAGKLGLKCVAEGVEDEGALRDLTNMGCDMAQGYHLSRPLPADHVLPFIRDHGATNH